MGQFSNSFPKQFSYLCEYAIRFDLSCSFCEYTFIFHCLHCSPSCFDPDSLLLAYFWLGLSWIDFISANKSFSSSKTSRRKPYTSSKQQERQKHSAETTINFSAVVAWHTPVCLGSGRGRASLACLVAPHWCAAPRLLPSLSVFRSAFPSPWCLLPPRGLSPIDLMGGCAGHVEAGHANRAHGVCASPCRGWGSGLARRRTRSGPRDRAVPGASRFLRSLAACTAVLSRLWTRSLNRPVSRTVRLLTGDSAGALGLFRDTDPVWAGGCHAWVPRVCACVCSSWPGRAGWPHSPRCLWRFVFSGPGCPLPWPSVFHSARPPFFFFPAFAFPVCLLRSLVSRLGCPGPWRCAVSFPPSFLVFLLPPPAGCLCFTLCCLLLPCFLLLVVLCCHGLLCVVRRSF